MLRNKISQIPLELQTKKQNASLENVPRHKQQKIFLISAHEIKNFHSASLAFLCLRLHRTTEEGQKVRFFNHWTWKAFILSSVFSPGDVERQLRNFICEILTRVHATLRSPEFSFIIANWWKHINWTRNIISFENLFLSSLVGAFEIEFASVKWIWCSLRKYRLPPDPRRFGSRSKLLIWFNFLLWIGFWFLIVPILKLISGMFSRKKRPCFCSFLFILDGACLELIVSCSKK